MSKKKNKRLSIARMVLRVSVWFGAGTVPSVCRFAGDKLATVLLGEGQFGELPINLLNGI